MLGTVVATWYGFSASLDDHDSCLLVAGVERFSLAEHRPHPPGYPLYVLLGKAITTLTGDASMALRGISVASMALIAVMLPALFLRLGCARNLAVALAMLVLATPCCWLTGSKVLTDAAGFAALLGLWLLHLDATVGCKAARRGFWLGVAAGLAAGVRPHLLLPLAPCLLQRPVAPRLLGVGLGVAVWFGGMSLCLGAGEVLQATSAQALMRFEQPNVSAFVGDGLLVRAGRFVRHFVDDAVGLEPWAPGAVLLLTVLALAVRRRGALLAPAPRARALVLTGAAVQLVFVFLLLPPHPRYFAVAMPALALLLAADRAWLATLSALAIGVWATVPRACALHEQVAAPMQALASMDDVDPARRWPLVSSKLFAHARTLAPERVAGERAWRPDVLPVGCFFSDDPGLLAAALAGRQGLRVLSRFRVERDEVVHDKEWRVAFALLERREPARTRH